MKKLIRDFLKDESGASLIEYVLIGGLISIIGVLLMTDIGTNVTNIWTKIKTDTGKAATP